MLNAWPLPHSPAIALDGLRQAVVRVNSAAGDMLGGRGGAPIWIALSEALYWVATLDDYANAEVADYFPKRDSDDNGRTVGGLVFARNMHAHEVVSTGEATFEIPPPTIILSPPGKALPIGSSTLFSVMCRWRPLVDLRSDGNPERRGRDAMYHKRVAGRTLAEPLEDAVKWFERAFGGTRLPPR